MVIRAPNFCMMSERAVCLIDFVNYFADSVKPIDPLN